MRERFASMGFREWVLQDWSANAGRAEIRALLTWFRLTQWAVLKFGSAGYVMNIPYRLITQQFMSIELPVKADIGPGLRIYHKDAIHISPSTTIGRDCALRHGVTIGNKVDRAGDEIGVPTVGDSADFGVGCVVIGDIHIGNHARIGALALVNKSVPDWGVAAGNPARLLRVDVPEPRPEALAEDQPGPGTQAATSPANAGLG
jgi:putative colanic acid biosynthesis acetyltransferase WcaB